MLEPTLGRCRMLLVLLSGACASLALCAAAFAQTAELIVVDRPGCPFCERFEREVAPAWPNTDEGRAVPLRRVSLRERWPDDLGAVVPPDLTPTFILVERGTELGRLVGYRGDEHFWFLIGQLLEVREELPRPTDRSGLTDATER